MTEAPSDLVLENLKVIQAALARLDRGQHSIEQRLAGVEQGLNGLRRDMLHSFEGDAHAQSRLDHLQRQVDRINVRLGLVEEPGS